MTTRRRPSANLTRIMKTIDEDELRRTRDRMLVACKIADTLKAKNITQKRFAEMIGKSESEISELEQRLSCPGEGDDIMAMTQKYVDLKNELDKDMELWASSAE